MSQTQAFLEQRTHFDHCFLLCAYLCGWLRLIRFCIVIIRQCDCTYMLMLKGKIALNERLLESPQLAKSLNGL